MAGRHRFPKLTLSSSLGCSERTCWRRCGAYQPIPRETRNGRLFSSLLCDPSLWHSITETVKNPPGILCPQCASHGTLVISYLVLRPRISVGKIYQATPQVHHHNLRGSPSGSMWGLSFMLLQTDEIGQLRGNFWCFKYLHPSNEIVGLCCCSIGLPSVPQSVSCIRLICCPISSSRSIVRLIRLISLKIKWKSLPSAITYSPSIEPKGYCLNLHRLIHGSKLWTTWPWKMVLCWNFFCREIMPWLVMSQRLIAWKVNLPSWTFTRLQMFVVCSHSPSLQVRISLGHRFKPNFFKR